VLKEYLVASQATTLPVSPAAAVDEGGRTKPASRSGAVRPD
jgi:hypothetical protein